MNPTQRNALAVALGLAPDASDAELRAAVHHADIIEQRAINALRPETVNEQELSIDVVLATESPVRMFDVKRFETVDEVLLMSGVDVDNIRRGKLPLQNAHQRCNADDTLGSLVDLRVDSEFTARAVFSSTERKLFTKAAEGHLDGMSVGYRVDASTYIEPGESDSVHGRNYTAPEARALKIVTRWTPVEGSLVPIGADAAAGTRNTPAILIPTPQRGTAMDDDIRAMLEEKGLSKSATDDEARRFLATLSTPSPEPESPSIDVEQIRRDAIENEQQRLADVNAVFDSFRHRDGVTDVIANLPRNATVEQARAALVTFLANSPDNAPLSRVVEDEADKTRTNMEAALVTRALSSYDSAALDNETIERAAPYRNMRLVDIASECVGRTVGHDTVRFLDPMELIGSAFCGQLQGRAINHATADFPHILANTAHKILLAGFAESRRTWRDWTFVMNVSDFKTHDLDMLSGFEVIAEVPEGAEFPHHSLIEKKEQVKASSYGNIFSITRQAVINDDLAAFTRVPFLQGMAWGRTINRKAVTKLLSNPTLSADNKALFHADHKNLTTGTTYAPTTTESAKKALNKLKTKLRLQTGLTGESIDLTPRLALTGPTAEDYILEAVSDVRTNDKDRTPNRGIRSLDIVIDPELENTNVNGHSTSAIYLFANQVVAPVIVVALLNGRAEPRLEQRVGWSVDGTEYKVAGDVGVGVADFRGVQKSTGA